MVCLRFASTIMDLAIHSRDTCELGKLGAYQHRQRDRSDGRRHRRPQGWADQLGQAGGSQHGLAAPAWPILDQHAVSAHAESKDRREQDPVRGRHRAADQPPWRRADAHAELLATATAPDRPACASSSSKQPAEVLDGRGDVAGLGLDGGCLDALSRAWDRWRWIRRCPPGRDERLIERGPHAGTELRSPKVVASRDVAPNDRSLSAAKVDKPADAADPDLGLGQHAGHEPELPGAS